MAVTSPISTAPRATVLKGNPQRREGVVASGVTTLKPGMLVDHDANGIKLGTASVQETTWAVENELAGYDIDDTYAVGDVAYYVVAQPGDELYVWLASGQDISIGERMQASTGGMLITLASGVAIAQALEAADLSGSPTVAAARIRVRVL